MKEPGSGRDGTRWGVKKYKGRLRRMKDFDEDEEHYEEEEEEDDIGSEEEASECTDA